MTTPDPSREPRLDRAVPGDAVPGSTISEDTEAEVLLQDGTWIWCQLIGQRKDWHGRWCVGIRWYASPSIGGREGWFVLNRRYIRRPDSSSAGRTADSTTDTRPRSRVRRAFMPSPCGVTELVRLGC
jgi:hypothetical protein